MQPHAKVSRWAIRAGALAAAVAGGSVAFGYYLQHPVSFWPVGNVEFQVALLPDPPNVPNPPLTDGSASWDAAFMVTLTKWNDVLPDAVLTLSGVTGSVVTPVRGDSVNNVFFSGTVYGDAWGSNTLGICLTSFTGTRRTEADILFNSTKTWDSYTGPLVSGKFDFRRVALHELGHGINLDHPDDVGQSVAAIMNSTSSDTDDLTDDDKIGVLAVYGGLTPVTISNLSEVAVIAGGGNLATFRVTATGSQALTYDWQRDLGGGFASFGLDGANFSISGWSIGNNGAPVRVLVSNAVGTKTSRTINLLVTAAGVAPAIDTNPPASVSVTEGEDIYLAVEVSGSPTPDIVWQMSTNGGSTWGNIFSSFGPAKTTGGTTPTLHIIRAITNIDGYQFRAVASSSSGSDAISTATTVNVAAGGPAPFFTYQPYDIATLTGTNLVFPVAVDGTGPLTLQWEQSLNGGAWTDVGATIEGLTVSGATTATLSITGATTALNGYQFRLEATNGSGTTTSRAVGPSIAAAAGAPTVSDPDDVNATIGGDAEFTAAVVAFPGAVHQWQYSTDGITFIDVQDGLFLDNSLIFGGQTRTLALEGVTAAIDGTEFRLVSTNSAGSDTSAAATLNVGAAGNPPVITSALTAGGTVGVAFSYTITATNTPTSYNATPLPDGLSIDTNTGVISGTPTTAGVTNTTITATNGDGSDNETLVITIAPAPPVINSSLAAGGTVGVAFSYTITATNTPTSFNATPLPDGLSIDTNTGVISGTPTTVGVTNTTITATNAGGSDNEPLVITIANPAAPGAPAAPALSASAYNRATVTWTAVGGATGYRVDVATDAGFTSFVSGYQDLDVGNVLTIDVSSLRLGTYHVRIRAYNAGGTSASSTVVSIAIGGRLINLSTRGVTQSGNPVIAGFFTLGATKRVLIIGVGPEWFAKVGLTSGTVPNPRLRVFDQGGQQIALNDDWDSSDADVQAALTAAGQGGRFTPGSNDAVLVLDLPPGGYSAHVETVTGDAGITSAEFYEVDDVGRLINISTRAHAGVGNDVLIPGTIFQGSSKRLLIRVVGETLGLLFPGVPNVLQDPTLEVYDQDKPLDPPILTNDDWTTNANAADILATMTPGDPLYIGAWTFGATSKDAALLVVLPANGAGYTIQARGKNGVTGTVLVEIYEIFE